MNCYRIAQLKSNFKLRLSLLQDEINFFQKQGLVVEVACKTHERDGVKQCLQQLTSLYPDEASMAFSGRWIKSITQLK